MPPLTPARCILCAAIFLAVGCLLFSCQDSATPHYFGHWNDALDGGTASVDGEAGDAAPATPDAAALTCTPAELGGGDDLRGLLAQASLWPRTSPQAEPSPLRPTGREVDDDDDDDENVVSDPRCLSGWRWAGGQHKSKLMQPGSDCLRCHRPSHDADRPEQTDDDDDDDDDKAPGYVVAGTVYGALHEPSDCLGVEGVTVRITDAHGQRLERTSNRAGNFYIKSRGTRLALPFTAELSAGGRTRRMQHPQCLTSCNVCHTATGDSGAPGRLLRP